MTGDDLYRGDAEIRRVFAVGHEQVITEQLGLQQQLFLVVDRLFEIQQKMSLRVVVGFDKPQQLDLIKRLVEEIFVIGDHLKTAHSASLQVTHFDHLGKHAAAEYGHHFIPPQQQSAN